MPGGTPLRRPSVANRGRGKKMKAKEWICIVGCAVNFAVFAQVGSPVHHEGLVEYGGSQKSIFDTGKAEGVVSLANMSASSATFGVGAAAGLDGEITVLRGSQYVTKMRGDTYALDLDPNQSAVFAVWTTQSQWVEQAITGDVVTYQDLQRFVKARAIADGIDAAKPFPFLLAGTPAEVKWHINVDRTEGRPIDRQLFAKSKESFVAVNQAMDIVGFYSEHHPGIFISVLAPGIRDKDAKNAIHIHMVTRDGKSAGHIDDVVLSKGMKLFLPKVAAQ